MRVARDHIETYTQLTWGAQISVLIGFEGFTDGYHKSNTENFIIMITRTLCREYLHRNRRSYSGTIVSLS